MPAVNACPAHAPNLMRACPTFAAALEARHPELAALLDLPRSPLRAVQALVLHLDDPTWVEAHLAELDLTAENPVVIEALEAVADTLLAALASVDGDAWRDRRVEAWVENHRLILRALGARRRPKNAAHATWTPLGPRPPRAA